MWRDANVHVFAPAWKALALNAMCVATVVPDKAARAFLKRINLYQKSKKAWRNLAGRNK